VIGAGESFDRIFIGHAHLFVCGIGVRFAAITPDYGQMLPCLQRASSYECCPLALELLLHRSVHALDEYRRLPVDALDRFRVWCRTRRSRASSVAMPPTSTLYASYASAHCSMPLKICGLRCSPWW